MHLPHNQMVTYRGERGWGGKAFYVDRNYVNSVDILVKHFNNTERERERDLHPDYTCH